MIKQWSEAVPGHALVWDATRLKAFLRDPLTYYWEYVLGYRLPPSPSMLLGQAWHQAVRAWWTAPRSEAFVAGAQALAAAWSPDSIPFGLARAVLALEDYGKWVEEKEWRGPLVWNGTPMVEAAVVARLRDPDGRPVDTRAGEPQYIMCRYDRILETDGGPVIMETKTTSAGISQWWFRRYYPSAQIAIQARLAPQARGFYIEAAQFLKYETRFALASIPLTPELRAWSSLVRWIRLAEEIAAGNLWYEYSILTDAIPDGYMNIVMSPRDMHLEMLELECGAPNRWDPLDPANGPVIFLEKAQ